jgi:hypothetical protein
MFSEFSGSWNFKEQPHGVTSVIFTYSFALRFPYNLFGWYIARDLKKNVQQRLIDLKTCIERKKFKSAVFVH